jgi:arginine exporter protein ArgO
MITAIEILLKGIILGLTVSMPLGPIGIILINRTIKRGMLSGFFSGVHVHGNINPELVPFFLIPGVLVGTISWWFFLSYFVSRFKKKIRLRLIVRINRVAGIVIIFIGAIVMLSVFTSIKL